jgi:hypothetical protein
VEGNGLERLVVGLLERACRQIWGFPPRMIPFIVARMGAVRGLLWFMVNMPRYLLTLRALGTVRTHLACVAISLHNGCRYCAYGHAYALELIYLRDRDRLFPVDAGTIASWLDLDARQLGARLRDVLQQAGLQAEALWVDCTLALAAGDQQPVDDAEARLAHLVGMVGLMNEVAVANCVEPDEAHDTINKNVAVKERHASLRAATT